jgi:hypothetical protein
MRLAAGALLLAAAAFGAAAHDTWFSPVPGSATAAARLELATGNRYPVQEVNPGAASLAKAGCLGTQWQRIPLQPAGDTPRALVLRAQKPGAVSCWAELKPFDIEIEPRLVQVYLDEIRAPSAVREAWKRLHERGVPWRESYRKFARIELQPQRGVDRKPAGLPLELVVLGDAPLRAGVPLQFRLLRDGRPLAGFPIELVSERGRIGVWRETDADGRIGHVLPFAGQWLLRGTEVRLAEDGERWTSRFVTLAIEAVR